MADIRPSWDEYFATLAKQVSTRTTCLRRAVGAVIVKENRILATGYNGVPKGMAHCAETGCLREKLGVTILLIEHDLKFVSGICDRITVLNFGTVIAQGATKDALSDPEVVKAYIGK
jgi:deoxycytidylate deaminase